MAITAETCNDIIELVVAATNSAPGTTLLSTLVADSEDGASLTDIAATLTASAAFTSVYPSFQTATEFATEFLANLVPEASDAGVAEGIAIIEGMLNGGATRADVVVEAATFLAALPETDAGFGTSAALFNNRVEVATNHTITLELDTDGAAALAGVTSDDVTVVTVIGINGGSTAAAEAAAASADANTANGLTTLTLSGSTGGTTTTITAAAATRALTVNLGANTNETIVDATATTVTVNSTSAHTIVALNFVKATTISINATANTTVSTIDSEVATALNLDATGGTLVVTETDTNGDNTIKTITVTGDKLVTLTDAIGTAVTSIDASDATGGTKVTAALNTATAYSGGSGVDTIIVPASSTKAVTTGDGNEVIVIGGAAGTGGSVDAGAGTGDVLSLTTALAANDSLSASTTFNGKISGFEILSLSASSAKTIDLNNLDNLSYVKLVTGIDDAVTLSNLDSGSTVELLDAGDDTLTVLVEDATLGGHSSDVLNLKLNDATDGGTIDYSIVVAAGVETINIESTRTGTIVAADDNQITLTVANAVNVVVTGGVKLNIDTAIAVATLTSVDGSANTKGLTASAAGADQGVELKGSTLGPNTLTGGNGGDVITGGTGVDTITGGEGADTYKPGTGNDILTLTETTAAADLYTYQGGFDTITGFDVGGTATDDNVILGKTAIELNAGVTAGSDMNGADLTTAATILLQTIIGERILSPTANVLIANLAGNIASTSALETALEAGGGLALTAAGAVAAADGMYVAYDDGTDSYIAIVEFDTGVLSGAVVTADDLIATNIIKFVGVSDVTTLVAADFGALIA